MSSKKSKKIQAESEQPEPVLVIVETPKGSRNKFKYDPELRAFKLGSVLPAGMAFPYDFGFVPGTQAEDGDPVDVLLYMDEPAFPGCYVDTRIIGVLEAEQEEEGQTVRNDRLLAVASQSRNYQQIRSLEDLSPHLIEEIERFFIAYNETRGKTFRIVGQHGAKRALKILQRAKVSK